MNFHFREVDFVELFHEISQKQLIVRENPRNLVNFVKRQFVPNDNSSQATIRPKFQKATIRPILKRRQFVPIIKSCNLSPI